jgi:glutamate N-acetyltransferase/amino-acid N-acetyltransferase
MVRPDMAKMLAVITTDAGVDSFTLRTVLQQAVDVSFNSLNIDGCQSTNDTVVVLASGGSAVQPAPEEFAGALTDVCGSLARQIAADAEGATRVVALRVSGATGDGEARLLGKWVADSDLVRSSFFGGDPNWGRIFGALGVGPVPIEPDAIVVRFAGVEVAREGCAVGFDRAALLEILDSGDFTVDIEVGDGPGRAEILTTDLTPDYVRFNGEPS